MSTRRWVRRLPGYVYSVSRGVDLKLVHVFKDKKEVFSVYVGSNPQLDGTKERYLCGS